MAANVDKLVKILTDSVESAPGKVDFHLLFLFQLIWEGTENWASYLPLYRPYYLNFETCCQFAKTHAIINQMLVMKRERLYTIKELFHAYMRLPLVTYRAGNLRYFYKKMQSCEQGTIQEELLHDFKINGRIPYKANPVVEWLVQSYYISPKRYSISMVHRLANLELTCRGMDKISRSTVSNICNKKEFQNKADLIRYGAKNAERNLIRYLKLKKPL